MVLGATIVVQGGVLTITGTGWVPGETVRLTVQSQTIDLGTVTARTDGTLPTVTFVVPAGFEPGTHTVREVGSQAGTRTATFVVTAVNTGTPTSATTTPGGTQVHTGGTSGHNPLVWVAFVVALVGFGLLLVRARVRR